MCYAIPAKIIKIDGENAIADYGGVIKTVNVSFLNDCKIGDYILVHAGFAIEKVNKSSAIDSLELIKKAINNINNK